MSQIEKLCYENVYRDIDILATGFSKEFIRYTLEKVADIDLTIGHEAMKMLVQAWFAAFYPEWYTAKSANFLVLLIMNRVIYHLMLVDAVGKCSDLAIKSQEK